MTSASIEPCELRGFSWQAQSVPALRDLDNVHNSTLQPCHTYRFRWIGAGPCLWLLVIPVDDFNDRLTPKNILRLPSFVHCCYYYFGHVACVSKCKTLRGFPLLLSAEKLVSTGA